MTASYGSRQSLSIGHGRVHRGECGKRILSRSPRPMQQPPHTKFISGRRAAGATAAGLLLALNGCGGPEPTHTDHKGPAHAGAVIRVSCPDKELAAVLTPLAKTWAGRAGATVEVATDPMAPGDAADVGVIPAADLGAWADRGELVPVPSAVKANPAYDDSDVIRAS